MLGKKNLIFLSIIIIFVLGCVAAMKLSYRAFPKPSTLTFLQKWRVTHNIPAVVATVSDRQGVHTFTAGVTSMHGKVAVTADSLFRVGSITKTFISAEVLLLESQGKLNINDNLGKWLPQYPEWKDITIKQLLNMTSGIYNYSEDKKTNHTQNNDPQTIWQPEHLVDVAYQRPLYFEPGSDWHYSNTNYVLAGMIIEEVTGQQLKTVLKNSLFVPNHLSHTYYINNHIPRKFAGKLVDGYQDDKEVSEQYTQGGTVISNSQDIALWIRALFTHVLPPKQLAEFKTVYQYTNNQEPKGSAYGLGVFTLASLNHGMVYWYTGVEPGFSAMFIWFPREKKVVSVTINRVFTNNYTLLFPYQDVFNYFLD